MDLFVVGNKNFTQHIKMSSYKVNRVDDYEEWKDVDKKRHREVTRTKVSGSFILLYDDIAELDDFFDTIEAARASHPSKALEMTVYLNNFHTTATITATIKYTPANERPYFGRQKTSGFEVSIEEL